MPKPTFKELSMDADWQHYRFLQHVQATSICPVTPAKKLHWHEAAVQDVLNAYRELVQRFYLQFRRELEAAYQQNAAQPEQVPLELQAALDKLIIEWERVETIALSSQSLAADEDLMQSIRSAVAVAAHDLEVDQKIVVVPREVFALYLFEYQENIAVLTVPVYSVRAPWEWSIFWHELAGYKARRLKKDLEISAIQHNLEFLHQLLTDPRFAGPAQKKFLAELLAAMTSHNPFGQRYLEICLTKGTPDLSDVGSFEYQFQRMLGKLAAADLENYERAKRQGWCSSWMKELFEDAWSVSAFGKKFLDTFEDILRRHALQDDQHPPVEVRRAVARNLLELQSLARKPGAPLDVELDKRRKRLEGRVARTAKEELRDELAAELAAQQTFKFISLLVPTKLPFDEPKWDDLVAAGDYQALKRIIHRRLQGGGIKFTKLDQSAAQKNASRKFKTSMVGAMQARAQFHSKKDPVTEAERYADNLIKTVLAKIEVIREDSSEPNSRPSYVNILKHRNYLQLLEVDFYDVDLFNGGPWRWPQWPPIQWPPFRWPPRPQYGVASAGSYAAGMGRRP
jgi:hypothetical protein